MRYVSFRILIWADQINFKSLTCISDGSCGSTLCHTRKDWGEHHHLHFAAINVE